MSKPWAVAAGGVTLAVRLTPKGGRDAIDGVKPMADRHAVLKVRVAAPPSEGEANDALIRVIAKGLSIPPRDISLAAGATSRIKRLMIVGDPASLIAALEKLVPAR